MNPNRIGDGVYREQHLHELMQALAKNQALTEQMVIESRGNRWHLGISLLRQELDPDHRGVVRKMVDFVAKSLGRDNPKGADFGSTLVEDLPIPGIVGVSDVVVSWADSEKELAKEVESIRSCLDALGIFHEEGQRALQEVHAEHVNVGVGDFSVRLDNQKHLLQASGNLKVGRVLAMLGHVIPGLGKTDLGGTLNLRIPYKDSRNKFIAAVLALELQGNGRLYTCAGMRNARKRWDRDNLSAEELQQQWDKAVQSHACLDEALAAVDPEMRRAYLAHPMGNYDETFYDAAVRSVKNGSYDEAIELLDPIQHPILPVKRAIGENYYLFAANVILQAQVAGFAEELEAVAKERFGIDLRQESAANRDGHLDRSAQGSDATAATGLPAADTETTPPPAFRSRRPGRRP